MTAAATSTLPPVARAQTAGRIEYARVTPYMVSFQKAPNHVQPRYGYRACTATTSEWKCREFEPTDASTGSLRATLATLGNEGWELVSAVNDDPVSSNPSGLLTYLFKRQTR
jgi:hypothetical protein